MLHQQSQKLPLLPLQAETAPYDLHAITDVDDELLTSGIAVHKFAWKSAPWARRLSTLAERSSTGSFPWLVGLPLIISVFAHIYFRMFSTLHIFLAFVWVGLPAATFSAIAVVASRYNSKIATGRDYFKAAILLALLGTVAWRTCTTSPRRAPTSVTLMPHSNETVFIAVNLYNAEHLFPAFSDSLFELMHHLGEDNVYVSIYESNSKDRTKQHLSLLQRDLERRGVQNRIRMLDNSRREELDRIERLAIIRNEALSPIHDGIHGIHNRTFTKLIWLNDIFYRPQSVLELLSTNQGHFDQVCALDYFPLGFYDTWVMHDVEGNRPTPLWPYFKREEDIASLRRGDAIAVNSCWNGMTVFDAKWFLPTTRRNNDTARPGIDDGPIRFRTHPECNVSECRLTSYDIHIRSKQRPLIFVNPKAVATYDYRDYLMYDWIMRSKIVNLWIHIWQDLISHALFSFFAEIGRKEDECRDALRSGWKTS